MFAAVAAFAAASCAQELDNAQLPAGETVTFEASVDGADTKVALDGKVSKWESGDKITIHNGTQGYEFSTQDAGVKAVFSYAGNDFAGEKFIAVYPTGTYNADVDAKTVTVNVPTYQPSRDNNFSVGAVPSIAYTENQTLSFKNASALLKFTVKGKNVKGLVFFGNNGEAVSGNVNVTLDADNKIKSLQAIETTITENGVTETRLLTWAKVWADTKDYCFVEGTTYYLSVVPQNFSKGFGVELEIDGVGLQKVKNLETAYDLKPNTILDLGELEYVAPAPSNNWGIAGTMTDWADNKDIKMTLEGDWYVAKNVTLDANAAFKFRTDGSWDNNRGTDGTPVAADAEVALTPNGQDIKAAVPAIYDIYMSKAADKMKLVKVGDVETPQPEVGNWGIVGTLTSWATNIAMTVEGDWYVAKNITITTEDGFKFRNGESWADKDLLTSTTQTVEAGTEYNTTGGAGEGNEIKVAASAIYDVYLATNLAKFKLVKVGDIQVEEPDPSDEPVASDWGIVGDINGWNAPDITMYSYNGMYVAYNVTFTVSGGFKIRKGGVWDDAANYGLDGGNANVTAGFYYNVVTSGGSGNLIVPAGTYDIWFDLTNKRIYVLNPGTDPATVSKGTPVAPLTDKWYLVGAFNSWKAADTKYQMTAEGTWYVFKNFNVSGEVKFVADANWSVNRGGSWAGVGKKINLYQGGANIKVTSGTYDVYLSSDAKYAYFMTVGSVPAN